MKSTAVAPWLLILPFAALAAAPALAAQDLGTSPSRWWGEIERVERLVTAEKWKKAARTAEQLRAEIVRSSWREPDLGQVFSELALQLAIAHASLDDEERAVWEWHSALAHERVAGPARGRPALEERDLAAHPRAAELFAAHPLRREGEYPPGHPPVQVRPDRDFFPAGAPAFSPEPLANQEAARQALPPVHFEVFVDRDGRVSQPVVTTPWSNPVTVQWGLDALRASPPFEPAVLDGETVGWLGPVELDLSSRPPKRW